MWEYKVEGIGGGTDLEMQRILNQHGSEGWELVSVCLRSTFAAGPVAFFKRKKPVAGVPV